MPAQDVEDPKKNSTVSRLRVHVHGHGFLPCSRVWFSLGTWTERLVARVFDDSKAGQL